MTAVYLHMQKRHWDYWVCASIAGLMIGGSALFLPANSAAAEVIVRVAPPATRVETVPPPPDRSYAWDPGHWQWNGRTYVWVPGHYIRYPHPHARWVPGHWVNRGGGWYWSPGTGDVSSKTFREPGPLGRSDPTAARYSAISRCQK